MAAHFLSSRSAGSFEVYRLRKLFTQIELICHGSIQTGMGKVSVSRKFKRMDKNLPVSIRVDLVHSDAEGRA